MLNTIKEIGRSAAEAATAEFAVVILFSLAAYVWFGLEP